MPVSRVITRNEMPSAIIWRTWARFSLGSEPDDPRGSRPVLRGAGGAIPPVYSPLSESHRLGLVLLVDHPRRLRLEAVRNHEGRGCQRHVELGAEGLGARPGKGHPPAKASLRQRPKSGRRSDWRSKLLCPRTCARGVIVVNSNALRN